MRTIPAIEPTFQAHSYHHSVEQSVPKKLTQLFFVLWKVSDQYEHRCA